METATRSGSGASDLAALLEWRLISPDEYGRLLQLLPPLDPNPALKIFLGNEPVQSDDTPQIENAMTADFSEFDDAADALENAGDCSDMCRALASMRRAADAICRIDGEASEACRRARGRVADAARRVTVAGCDCDGAPPIA